MKKICVLSLFLILIQLTLAQGENKRVLFIGNSYTDVNNLPQLIQLAAESTGDSNGALRAGRIYPANGYGSAWNGSPEDGCRPDEKGRCY